MNLNIRKIFIISVLVICVIAINIVFFLKITEKPKVKKEESNPEQVLDTAKLSENFENIFNNIIDYQNNAFNVVKINSKEELVYTYYENEDKKEKAYEVNVKIPCINISNNTAKSINEEINNLFYKKAVSIIAEQSNDTIYNVDYKAYLNDNILSLIIRATLKEGNNPQREIIKTYNYNISSNSILKINEILEYRSISEQFAQDKIRETVKLASESARKYMDLGYTKYLRNSEDSMYKLENTNVYFLGYNKAIYILYPYGNTNYTSEVDILVL